MSKRRAHWLASGTLAVPLLILGVATVVVLPLLAYSLVARGITESHPSWVALGVILGGLWLLGLWLTLRKLLAPTPSPAGDLPPPDPTSDSPR